MAKTLVRIQKSISKSYNQKKKKKKKKKKTKKNVDEDDNSLKQTSNWAVKDVEVTLCYQDDSLAGMPNDSAWRDGAVLMVRSSLCRPSDHGPELSSRGKGAHSPAILTT